jgi:DNA-directed RNA polymerase subunit M/transcription elongation factor TFIIS
MSTYFNQPCPTCGRMLQVRIQYLGRRLSCRHCSGEFQASDPDNAEYPRPDANNTLMQRVSRLLDSRDGFS